ncbi:hypothetical protein MRX96_059512 [Rhipicephalus microplus]
MRRRRRTKIRRRPVCPCPFPNAGLYRSRSTANVRRRGERQLAPGALANGTQDGSPRPFILTRLAADERGKEKGITQRRDAKKNRERIGRRTNDAENTVGQQATTNPSTGFSQKGARYVA